MIGWQLKSRLNVKNFTVFAPLDFLWNKWRASNLRPLTIRNKYRQCFLTKEHVKFTQKETGIFVGLGKYVGGDERISISILLALLRRFCWKQGTVNGLVFHCEQISKSELVPVWKVVFLLSSIPDNNFFKKNHMYQYVVLNSRKFPSDMSYILFISDVPQEIHHRTDVTIVMGFTADAFHQARASIFRKKIILSYNSMAYLYRYWY